MSKKSKKVEKGFNTIFEALLGNDNKRKKLREVLKQHDKTLDDYKWLKKKKEYL